MGQAFDLAIMTPSSAFGTSATIPLGSAAVVNGVTYLSFGAAGAVGGAAVSYSLLDPVNGGSETGTATYLSSNTTLTGRTPTFSTNSSFINASSGTLIQSAIRAEDAAIVNLANTFSANNTFSVNQTFSGLILANGGIRSAATVSATPTLESETQTGISVTTSSFQAITPATAGAGTFMMLVAGTLQNAHPALFLLQDAATPLIVAQGTPTSSTWQASSSPLIYGIAYSSAAGRHNVYNNIGATETFKAMLLRSG